MRRYPQLESTAHHTKAYADLESKLKTRETQTTNVFSGLDRSLLSSIILTNRTLANPQLVICQAEAGGGVCANPKCEDLHLDRGDPTGEYCLFITEKGSVLRSSRGLGGIRRAGFDCREPQSAEEEDPSSHHGYHWD